MNDTAARIATACEELAAELEHADSLITEQQARIETLEGQVGLLQSLLKAPEAAA